LTEAYAAELKALGVTVVQPNFKEKGAFNSAYGAAFDRNVARFRSLNERGVRAMKGYAAFATADVTELAIREDECLVVQLLAGMRRSLVPPPSTTTAKQAAKGERAFWLEDGSDK
jgi:hypothetical protein